MKKLLIAMAAVAVTVSAGRAGAQDLVKDNFKFAEKQLGYAVKVMDSVRVNLSPKQKERVKSRGVAVSARSIYGDGTLHVIPSKDWTSGFFPGELWLMYEYTKDPKWKDVAMRYTKMQEPEQYNTSTHDIGFMMYDSYGNALRLTGDQSLKPVLLQSARSLMTRYNPTVGCIRSWDSHPNKWKFPVIIDNMMNLELLFWAARESGDKTFYDAAVKHAETTMKNHFRKDGSTWHVVSYDPATGKVEKKNTHQGYAHESAWARGQGWAIYGYTVMYRETGNKKYLKQAEKTLDFIMNHKNMPADLVPYWDYDDPAIPNAPRDASAATLVASALYEMSMYDKKRSAEFVKLADTILENVAKSYRNPLYTKYGFLLDHSTGNKPGNSEIDTPLNYADFYFIQALLRKHKLETTGKAL